MVRVASVGQNGGVSSLKERIENDLATAMKAREETKVSTLRMLKSVEAIASSIIQHRLGEKFVDVEAFVAFCKQQGKILSDEDRFRIVAEARGN